MNASACRPIFKKLLRSQIIFAALLCGVGCSSTPQVHLTRPDIVSWWAAEGNAQDNLGKNHGIPINSPGYSAGVVGQAFNFNGASQYILIPDSPTLHFTNALTVESWIFPTTYHPPATSILIKYDGVIGVDESCFGFSINYPEKTFYLLLSRDGTPQNSGQLNSTSTVPLNRWTHLAATYDGATIKLYFNGRLDATRHYSGGFFPGTDNMAIGGNVGGLGRHRVIAPFTGLIDEVTLYKRALSDKEISAIYDADLTRKRSAQLDQ